jgi:hypothetical protein
MIRDHYNHNIKGSLDAASKLKLSKKKIRGDSQCNHSIKYHETFNIETQIIFFLLSRFAPNARPMQQSVMHRRAKIFFFSLHSISPPRNFRSSLLSTHTKGPNVERHHVASSFFLLFLVSNGSHRLRVPLRRYERSRRAIV